MNAALAALSDRAFAGTMAAMDDRQQRSFSDVYTTYKHAIYTYVLYRVGMDAEQAADITSDIFVKAYTKFDTYDSQYAMSTWLYTIARNTLIDHYRKQKDVVVYDEQSELTDTKDELYRLLTENISLPEVEQAIAELPETQQLCLREQFFAGKTAAVIAKEQGMSHAAVRKQVSRAIATLRGALLSFVPLLINLTLIV